MKSDDIGPSDIEEMAEVVVRRLKDEPFWFRRTGKPLYLVFTKGGGGYIRKIPHNDPRDIAYKMEGVPGGPGEMHYILSPMGKKGGDGEIDESVHGGTKQKGSTRHPN